MQVKRKRIINSGKAKSLELLLKQTKNVKCAICDYIQHKRHKNCQYCGNEINK